MVPWCEEKGLFHRQETPTIMWRNREIIMGKSFIREKGVWRDTGIKEAHSSGSVGKISQMSGIATKKKWNFKNIRR